MIALSRIAPELRPATRRMSLPWPFGSRWGRGLLRSLFVLLPEVKQDAVRIDTPTGTPVPLRIYEPWERVRDGRGGSGRGGNGSGALLWIHGGGYIVGGARQDDAFCIAVAQELGIMVVGVDYRLAPEHAFPAPLDDCHGAWTWMQARAVALGIDPARMAIGGQSAGGGLAATLVQRLHDEGGPQPVAQWLFCPMLDDRTAARRDLDAVGHRVWNNRNNRSGWSCYLGGEPGAADQPPYAVAARAEDVGGLPPAWIGVGDVDLFHEEDRIYAERLRPTVSRHGRRERIWPEPISRARGRGCASNWRIGTRSPDRPEDGRPFILCKAVVVHCPERCRLLQGWDSQQSRGQSGPCVESSESWGARMWRTGCSTG